MNNRTEKRKWHIWEEDEFKQTVKQINSNITILNFTRIRKKAECQCNICGYKWSPEAYSLIAGNGCPKCSGKVRLNFPEFKKEFNSSNDLNIEILSNVAIKTTDKIKCRCKACGNVWITDVNHLKHNHGCNSCRHTGTSFMEQAILKAFRLRLGDEDVLSRNRTLINKELDIVIPSKNIAFEPGTWNFHKKKIKDDLVKQKLCREINIRLIIIYDMFKDDCFSSINDCITYTCELGAYKNRTELRRLIDKLFSLTEIHPLIDDDEWKIIQDYANKFAMKKTPQEIINEIKEINPNIIFIEMPTRYSEKVLCKCLKCEHEWLTSPTYIKSGTGCPQCNPTRKLTQEEFNKRVKEINHNITPLEQYKNITTPIKFKCNICNYEWKTIPRNVLNVDISCPKCRKINQLKHTLAKNNINILSEDDKIIDQLSNVNPKSTYNTKEFVWLMSKINSDIELLDEYKNINKKVKCKCKKCSTVSYMKPQHLLNGHGCFKCNSPFYNLKD